MTATADAAPPLASSSALATVGSSHVVKGRSPVTDEVAAGQVTWTRLAARTAQRARRRARALPGVTKARFQVDLSPEGPSLSARVSLLVGSEMTEAVDAVMEIIVPEMEQALGRRFATNEIEFSIAQALPLLGRHESPPSVLSIV
ncbi:hypothetical protein CFK41_02640 [Brachybacterium ginsengisoli]|uniref:Uncharacterized protein n=1 Tax=Brachybacterium ginsengisoli TaxID=1331682 RepID=A0A291GUD3_9MICO|nr:hypothetical protein [Brachybacterium ginsengisoli]ATG53798.1 hypothetical protein CFK41_02640 [Brachybacterium ginsengisoli]